MRTFLVLLVAAGLGLAFYHQKHAAETTTTEPTAQATPAHIAQAATTQAAAPQQPQVSEHNWMKRSLDRAREVRDTSRAQTQEAQRP